MDFVIDRSKWIAGTEGKYGIGRGDTHLLNSSGFMCCLGHCALQLGATKKSIKLVGCPSHVADRTQRAKLACIGNDVDGDDFENQAIEINDAARMLQRERETRLAKLFKRYGHRIKFVGKAVKP